MISYHGFYCLWNGVKMNQYKTKKEIIKQFGVAIGTLNNDLTEMRRMAQFKDGILKPSHKRVYVNSEIYEEFLRYKQMKREEAM